MQHIRQAEKRDVSRIAEILIFSKRTHYRAIYHDDPVSFGEMQVLPLAESLLKDDALLRRYWVYDDCFVKGLVRIEGDWIEELYVEPFFEGQGVGGALMDFATKEMGASCLWVLEKNARAIGFYQKRGFRPTGERKLHPGTPEYLMKMSL